jgi:hypothetical protein
MDGSIRDNMVGLGVYCGGTNQMVIQHKNGPEAERSHGLTDGILDAPQRTGK